MVTGRPAAAPRGRRRQHEHRPRALAGRRARAALAPDDAPRRDVRRDRALGPGPLRRGPGAGRALADAGHRRERRAVAEVLAPPGAAADPRARASLRRARRQDGNADPLRHAAGGRRRPHRQRRRRARAAGRAVHRGRLRHRDDLRRRDGPGRVRGRRHRSRASRSRPRLSSRRRRGSGASRSGGPTASSARRRRARSSRGSTSVTSRSWTA